MLTIKDLIKAEIIAGAYKDYNKINNSKSDKEAVIHLANSLGGFLLADLWEELTDQDLDQ